MKTIVLASGQITAADTLTIELVEASETPPAVLLRWPLAESVTSPGDFPAVANAILEVLAAASTRLGLIKAARPW